MNLRKKLFVTFGGLALMALTVAGVTLWSMTEWQKTSTMLEEHYQRSLLLQQIRKAVFRALKEIPDALTKRDNDAQEEFFAKTNSVEADFETWANLAHTITEREQINDIRAAYDKIIADANEFFGLVEQNQLDEATRFMEQQLEEGSLETFESLTEAGVASDQAYRQQVQEQVTWTRETDKIVLAIAAFGTISLILLMFAYLSSDLFAPLQALTIALGAVATGDYKQRLAENRNDEFGAVHRAFNLMVEAVAQRQRLSGLHHMNDTQGTVGSLETDLKDWQNTPSRLTLHRLLGQLKRRIRQLSHAQRDTDAQTQVEATSVVSAELDTLLDTVMRFADFGFPLDLNLTRFDIRALLYEVLLRFHELFAQRSVSFEIDVSPALEMVVADRLKLREILAELIRNALKALTHRGGNIGLRASLKEEGNALQIEVADNGQGISPQLINREFLSQDIGDEPSMLGLNFARSVIEQHGGQFIVNAQPGKGTYVRLIIPMRV